MNDVSLVGRLTRDPELRHTPSGTAVCDITLAVDRSGPMEDGKPGAGFFDVTLWGKTAEVAAEYLSKGRQVGISGELRFSKWQADDGTNRSRVTVNGRSLTFVGNRGDDSSGSSSSSRSSEGAHDDPDDDDIPF